GAGVPGTASDDASTIACGTGALRPLIVQRAGRPAMDTAASLRGRAVPAGTPSRMTRFALTLEWNGQPYMGFQRQAHGPSVQQAVEEAAFEVTGQVVTLHAAGRTDTGVHALAMRAHFDSARDFDAFRSSEALNARLRSAGHAVAVSDARVVDADWHARFSCSGRAYEYRIANRRAPSTSEAGSAWRIARPSDAGAMHAAARESVGHHDFTTFRSVHCQAASPLKTLDRSDVRREGDHVIVEAAARSFLHH
ncbi:hypothetical protein OY671_008601, partial [Metschnikowia pulcherrima]